MGDRHITFSWGHRGGTWKHGGTWDGFVADLLDGYRKTNNPMRRRQLEKYMSFAKCSACSGKRLNRQAQAVVLRAEGSEPRAKGSKKSKSAPLDPQPLALSLPEACSLDIATAAQFFGTLQLDDTQQFIAEEVLKEIRGRLGFLLRCGLDSSDSRPNAPTPLRR